MKFGFSEEDIKFYGLDKYIYSDKFIKGINDDKDIEKSIEKIEKFFEKIIYYIGPIQCALKSIDSVFQINEIFEKLSTKNENEWNNYQVEKL